MEIVTLEGPIQLRQGIEIGKTRVPVVPDLVGVHPAGGQVGRVPEEGGGHEQIEVGKTSDRGVVERGLADLRP